jgi:hypothetical protein
MKNGATGATLGVNEIKVKQLLVATRLEKELLL